MSATGIITLFVGFKPRICFDTILYLILMLIIGGVDLLVLYYFENVNIS